MKTIHFITSYWYPNIPIIFTAMALSFFHLWSNARGTGRMFRFTKRSPVFFAGIFLLLIVTQSPLNFLGGQYLFSAHMVEHVILLLVIPPLLLNGMDPGYTEKLFQHRVVRRMFHFVLIPSIAWIIGVASMWVLHIPAIYDTIHKAPVLMTGQMIFLMIMGLVFIWPVYAPIAWHRLNPLESSVYLFMACVGCTVLGILITFTNISLYESCMTGRNISVLNLIRQQWGITPNLDQQIGGLIMWVPACVIYLTNIVVVLGRWFQRTETEEI